MASESALRSDIAAANTNSFADNVIELSSSISLSDTAAGQLVIQNGTSTAKSLTIESQGASQSVISGFTAGWNSRIFEIVGAGGAGVTVVFKNLVIEGGEAHDGGALGGTAALGGGILVDGGQVTLSGASMTKNYARGSRGRGHGRHGRQDRRQRQRRCQCIWGRHLRGGRPTDPDQL